MKHFLGWSLLFCSTILTYKSYAQAPANALGGYANVDNNLNKVPKFFIGIHPLSGEYRGGISVRPGAHIKLRGDGFGELQLNATFTPDPLVKVPASPFGSNYRCNCADNSMTAYMDADASYTFYVVRKNLDRNYKVVIERPGINFSLNSPVEGGRKEKIPGQLNRFYGIRLGAAYQKGDFYQLSAKRTRAYDNFEQQLVFLGFSRTTIGRMFRNFEGYGIKGKNIHSQFYADAFYALDQQFHYTPVALYDSQGNLRTEKDNPIPYGVRLGATVYKYGFRSRTAVYGTFETGIRPTFDDLLNGFYLGLKLGVGIGFGKTPVYYVSNHQNKVFGRKPNIDGNGRYKERKGLGKLFHKREPLKMIRHRYGK